MLLKYNDIVFDIDCEWLVSMWVVDKVGIWLKYHVNYDIAFGTN